MTKRLLLQLRCVPIVGGHSEAVNVEFSNDFEVSDIQSFLHHTDGVVVQDNNDTILIRCQCMRKER
jgi:aspartate-semialdehyde dehydrogenase